MGSKSVIHIRGEPRKHHSDRYETYDTDWEKEEAQRADQQGRREREGGLYCTTTAQAAACKALSPIAASPLSKQLQEATLPSKVKHWPT